MHHDENDPRHPHHRDQRFRREHRPEGFERDQNFNDFKSRWGEPSPPLNLHRNEWPPRDMGRFEQEERRFDQPREEWLPEGRREHQQHEHHPRDRDNSWRQRDANFDRNNQRAEDRWQQDSPIQDPDDSRRRRRGLPDHEGNWDERDREHRNHR